MTIAYKIIDVGLWRDARAAGVFHGAEIDLKDGYIHLSTADQMAETASRHFAGRDGLRVLAVDLTALGEEVRWEPSRGGALFPHVYGPLPVAAVVSERTLAVSPDGELDLGPETAL